jgi:sugar lactone lactonase YvrE
LEETVTRTTLHRAGVVVFVACLAVAPLLAHPGSGIAVDRRGNVLFADTGGGVWKIDTERRVTRVDVNRFHWMAIDLDGGFAKGRMPTSSTGDFARAGVDPTLILSSDFPVVIGQDGAFYYPEPGGPDGRVQLMRWTPAGERSVVATLPASTDSGPLKWINGLAVGPDGTFYYTENAAVRRVNARGEISTVVTRVAVERCIDVPGNEQATGVFLRGLAVAADGTVYVAAAGCGAVLRISPQGAITPVSRTTAPWSPTAVAVAGPNVYVLEYLHTANEDRVAWIPRVRLLRADGTSVVLATISRK